MDLRLRKHSGLVWPDLQCRQLSTLPRSLQLHACASWLSVLLVDCVAVGRLSGPWQLALAIAVEAFWEVFENTNFIIDRYRSETAALGYNGDTVVNSFGDILCCLLGFIVARRLGLAPFVDRIRLARADLDRLDQRQPAAGDSDAGGSRSTRFEAGRCVGEQSVNSQAVSSQQVRCRNVR